MLNKRNFEIAALCPKDNGFSKYALSGIRVTPDETVATSGHILIKISGCGPPEPFDPFILPASVALKVAAALPIGSKIPDLDEADIEHVAGSAASISVRNQDTDYDVYSARPLEGQYPDTDHIIPAVEGAAVEMVFDLDILIPLLERVRIFHGKKSKQPTRIASFRFYKEPGAAQRIDAENALGQKLTAVVMPRRDQSDG